MEYAILIYGDETTPRPSYGEPGFEEFMGTWLAFNQKLIDGGHWVSGASLQPTPTATTVKFNGGTTTVVDGPFAETKEQFGGFYVISAENLDEAIELAKAMPVSAASIEVRPVSFRPDAA